MAVLRRATIARIAPRRVLLITAVMFAVVMGDSMLYNVLPANVAAFGISAGLVGVVLSVNRFVRLISNPLAAWAFQRFGLNKSLLLLTILVSVGTTLAYGLGHGFGVLLLARLLWGMCYSLLRLGGYLVVLEDSGESARGRAMGVFVAGGRAGSMVGVLVGGLLFDVGGRASSFLVIGALGLISLPVPLALGRGHQRKAQRSTVATPATSPLAEHVVNEHRGRLWPALGGLVSPAPELTRMQLRRLLAVDFTIFALYFVVLGVIESTLGFFLNEKLGEGGVSIAGLAIGVATLNGILLSTNWASGLAAPYLGHLGDRFGRARLVAMATPVCLVALVLLAFPPALWLTLLALPLAFVAGATIQVSLDALAGGIAPVSRRAQMMGRYATWADVGSATAPLLAYAVLEFASLAWIFLGSALLLGGALALFLTSFRGDIAGGRGARGVA